MIRLVGLLVLTMGLFAPLVAGAEEKEDREGGIIGTGIVGTITELGSIWVNGQHITFAPDLEVVGRGPGIRARDLIPGQTVAVVAEPANGGWQARYIRHVLPLTGPVAAVENGLATILGTSVRIPQGQTVRIGDWVAVNGLWSGDVVIASLIEPLEDDTRVASLSGSYLGRADDGALRVGGSVIRGIVPEHIGPGDMIRVSGQARQDGIQAQRLESGLFDAAVGVVLVEGYLSPPTPEGLYTVLGSGLVAFTDRPEMIDVSNPRLLCGLEGRLNPTGQDAASAGNFDAFARLGCDIR